jgi:hypothetical protein
MCYKIKSTSGAPPFGTVFTRNQFETASFTLRGGRELCVPALKGAVTTSTSTTSTSTTVQGAVCGNGTVEPPEQCDPPGPNPAQCNSPGGAFICKGNCTCSPSGAFLDD